jgi:hypothetical protein
VSSQQLRVIAEATVAWVRLNDRHPPCDGDDDFETEINPRNRDGSHLLLALWMNLPVSAVFTDGKLRTRTTKTLGKDIEKL